MNTRPQWLIPPDQRVHPMRDPLRITRLETILWSLLTALLSILVIALVGFMSQLQPPEDLAWQLTMTLAGLSGLFALCASLFGLANMP